MDFASEITDFSADGISRTVGGLIKDGTLQPGEKLPTVREMAQKLGTSPATVSSAWQRLRRAGMILTDGRRGTVVRTPSILEGGTRFSEIHRSNAKSLLDLSESGPDPRLMPDWRAALAALSNDQRPSSYFDPPVLPELEEVLRAGWPFVPDALTVVDGTTDAVDRILSACVGPGSRVLVENPTYPPFLDLLDLHGAEVVGLATDEGGIRPESLAEVLGRRDADVVLLQPNAQNPTGHRMDRERCQAVAHALRNSKALVIEDDHSFGICESRSCSVGEFLPDRTVVVRGFSKAYGPDLRMAAVGGAAGPLTEITRRRILGPGWSSRLLQSILLFLLTDPTSVAAVTRAGEEYRLRRGRLMQELTDRGVEVMGRDGTNLWLTVHDEHETLISLALQGVAASPGSAFVVSPLVQDHIRIACGSVDADFESLAEILATASTARRRRRTR